MSRRRFGHLTSRIRATREFLIVIFPALTCGAIFQRPRWRISMHSLVNGKSSIFPEPTCGAIFQSQGGR
jgi:hypothetical protein